MRYLPKALAFVKRCVALSRHLLAHDSTADTARDLDHLRKLVGDRTLNYRGVSFGTFIGQTYANMFPRRVRAMVLDGAVDPVPFTTSAQAFIASGEADFDVVFSKLQSLCQSAGPSRCALAGDGSVKARVSGLLARLRHGPIPAPSAPAPHRLSYGDLLLYVFPNLGEPAIWPQIAAGLEQAASVNGSAIETALQQARPLYQSMLNSGTALQCADRAATAAGPAGVAEHNRPADAGQPVSGGARLVAGGAVRRLAAGERRPLQRTVEQVDPQPDPGDRHPV